MIMKKIFEGIYDEEVHSDFLKFSRGEFKDKYLIEGKKQTDKWAIKSSAEFVNSFVRKCLEKAEGTLKIKGIIVSTLDLEDEIGFEIKKKSNFQGVKKLQIDTEVEPKKVLEMMEKYPRVFFALSFKTKDCDIKVKAKAPKSSKPGKKDEDGPKADFCTLKTNDEDLVKEIFFDVGLDWKEAKINHTIEINGIVYPENMNEMKPAEIRENSKRKGKIIRNINLDGNEQTSEAEFVA